MLSIKELTSISRARLKDAAALLSKGRFDGATYLCGYSSFKSHDLNVLVHLSGWEPRIFAKYLAEWATLNRWSPESRYRPPGNMSHAEATAMLESAKRIVEVLL